MKKIIFFGLLAISIMSFNGLKGMKRRGQDIEFSHRMSVQDWQKNFFSNHGNVFKKRRGAIPNIMSLSSHKNQFPVSVYNVNNNQELDRLCGVYQGMYAYPIVPIVNKADIDPFHYQKQLDKTYNLNESIAKEKKGSKQFVQHTKQFKKIRKDVREIDKMQHHPILVEDKTHNNFHTTINPHKIFDVNIINKSTEHEVTLQCDTSQYPIAEIKIVTTNNVSYLS